MGTTIAGEDEEAIRELVQRASTSQSDPDALVPLHTSDMVVVNLGGRRVFGRDAFEEAMRAALASSLKDVVTEVEIIDIRAVSPTVALVSCLKTVHDQREAGTGDELPAVAGALTYVVIRAGDAWQIALAQTTPIRP